MRENLLILLTFLLGVLIGIKGWIPPSVDISQMTLYLLYGLMFVVGLSVGNDGGTLRGFFRLPRHILLLPFLSITGTIFGGVVASLLLQTSLFPTLAIASGQAYYSISSVILSQKLGAAIGAVALLSNIFRELLAILFAPLLARYFGKYAPIAAGGATTMDITLPFILKASGEEQLVPSVYHGFVCDLSVPFLVTLFASLS